MEYKNLIGKKINNLTIKEIIKIPIYKKNGKKNGNKYLCKCLCDCGNIKKVNMFHVISGHTKSCGCLCVKKSKERIGKLNLKHGLAHKTKLYGVWLTMKARCYRKSCKKYKNYGGRGITVCDEWKNSFQNFHNWAINNGYKDGLTLDRIDVNGNYCSKNCRLVSLKEQARNKRNTIYVYYKNEKKTLKEWCEIFKLNYSKAYYFIVKKGKQYFDLTC